MNESEEIILGDGKSYVMKIFTVGDFITVEKKFGNLTLDVAKMEPMIFWLWLALRKSNKDLKIEELYELIDAKFISKGGLNEAFDKLSILNGWDKAPKNFPRPVGKESPSTN